MYANSNQPATVGEVASRDIPAALASLENAVIYAAELTEAIEKILSPILGHSSSPPPGGSQSSGPVPVRAPLAETIEAYVNRVAEINQRLLNITGRIQL